MLVETFIVEIIVHEKSKCLCTMNESYREILKKEFDDFEIPKHFARGCKKSALVQGVCVHLRPDGTIGKIEEGCPDYDNCKGFDFKYHI